MGRSRALAVLALGALLLGAGCSADKDDAAPAPSSSITSVAPHLAPQPSPSGSGSNSGGTGTGENDVAKGNAKQICVDARAASAKGVSTFLAELGNMLEAAGKGDGKAEYEARKKAEAALVAWSNAMAEQAAKATDGQLRDVLEDISNQVGMMRADIDSVDSARLDELQQRLDKLCG